ncbi:hypothetical protein ANO11243_054360 [Dothideomycetidae sp. 11243]|nr:hypothetical protein ANO11243_054360 [fungal sp. No.11243]
MDADMAPRDVAQPTNSPTPRPRTPSLLHSSETHENQYDSSISPTSDDSKSSPDRSISPKPGRFSLENPTVLKTFIIGFSDGVTVPFALTAGLSSLEDSRIIIIAGLGELIAGAISMGLGAFLAAMTENQQYRVVESKEREKLRFGTDAMVDANTSRPHDLESSASAEKPSGVPEAQTAPSASYTHTIEKQLVRTFHEFGVQKHDIQPLAQRLSYDENL